MPFQSQWHTCPNTDRTCVKSLSRKCLEQHWGFANYIVRFPMQNPDSASYSIVRLCTRVRSFHRDQSQWSHTMFPAIFNSFCPGTANVFCPTRAHLCWQVYSIWGAGLIHHVSKSFTIFVKFFKIQFKTTTLKCTEPWPTIGMITGHNRLHGMTLPRIRFTGLDRRTWKPAMSKGEVGNCCASSFIQ